MSLNFKKLALSLVAGVAGVVAGAPNAQAFGWGSSGGSSGSSGSSGYAYAGSSGYAYGSSGGSSGYSSGGSSGYSSGGSSGHSRQGFFARWHARHHWNHGSSGGSSGYSSGGSSGHSSGGSSGYSYGSSGGSSGSSGGSSGMSGGAAYYGAVPGGVVMSETPADAAVLQVNVPADAKVFVNGYETTSTGESRRYVSSGLENGKSYTYELKAEIVRDGKPVTESQTVKMQAGQTQQVTFALNANPAAGEKVVSEPSKTKLTLKVPADAKVFIAGYETKATGEVREFATAKLAAGQAWDNYTVRVEAMRDGQLVSHEEKLTLIGGEDRSLEVNLDAPKLASAK